MSNDVQQRPAAWEGFVGGNWETNVDVRDFIQKTTRHMKRCLFLGTSNRSHNQAVGGSDGKASRLKTVRTSRTKSTRKSSPVLPATLQAISTKIWKPLSACKQTSL